jgi:hypothetical protein
MDKLAKRKAIASARYFKNKGEIDMWHSVWHKGKPYDYHLYEENGVSEVYVYKVKKVNGQYEVDTSTTLHIHTFNQ